MILLRKHEQLEIGAGVSVSFAIHLPSCLEICYSRESMRVQLLEKQGKQA